MSYILLFSSYNLYDFWYLFVSIRVKKKNWNQKFLNQKNQKLKFKCKKKFLIFSLSACAYKVQLIIFIKICFPLKFLRFRELIFLSNIIYFSWNNNCLVMWNKISRMNKLTTCWWTIVDGTGWGERKFDDRNRLNPIHRERPATNNRASNNPFLHLPVSFLPVAIFELFSH